MKKSIFLLGILLSGCVSLPTNYVRYSFDREKVFAASFEEAWQAITKTAISSGELISVSDKQSGLISLTKRIPQNKLKEIAFIPKGVVYGSPEAKINILAQRVDDIHIKIVVNLKISGCVDSILRATCKDFDSKGIIEKDYFEKIETLLTDQQR